MSEQRAGLMKLIRPNRGEPEDSIPLRVSVALATLISVAAVLAQDIIATRVGLTVIFLILVGSFVSYQRRRSRQIVVKLLLTAGLLLAFANFLRGVSGAASIDDTRIPLAEIFLWVQALHSFDQPRRRDLHFSLAASVALVALGGSLSLGSSYLIFFVPWGLTAMAALVFSHTSEIEEVQRKAGGPSQSTPVARSFPSVRVTALILAVVTAVGSLVFLFAPRGRGLQFQDLPFKLPELVPTGADEGIVNKGLPNNDAPSEQPASPEGGAYFGLANFVDLRVRGELSEEIVMRVRAPQPAFWRGPTFDTYSSNAWINTQSDERKISGTPATLFPPEVTSDVPRVEMTQTYFVEKTQSNVVFAAYEPTEVWFPGGSTEVTDSRALRAPFLLEEGLVYSVVSEGLAPSPSQLRVTTDGTPPELMERYTRLPAELPSRVSDLAAEIAGDEPTIIGKVDAITEWLSQNTTYLLDLPPQPRGVDAVDYFLFEDRRGFCEHIASSLALMLRAEGVPTRFATGYEAGERNLFSGLFEVRGRNAHSWVEVFFPGVGWMQFDPTHEVPFADEADQTAPGASVLRRLFALIAALVPDGLLKGIGAILGAVVTFVQRSALGASVALAGVALLVWGAFHFIPRVRSALEKRRRRRPLQGSPKEIVIGAFRLVEQAGFQAGLPRPDDMTPSEYGRFLANRRPDLSDELNHVVGGIELEIYGEDGIDRSHASAIEASARKVTERLESVS